MNSSDANRQAVVKDVENWLSDCVLGLSLCPYARAPYQAGRVRIVLAEHHQPLQGMLKQEIEYLKHHEAEVETSLIVLMAGLSEFLDFNDCVGGLEEELDREGLNRDFQLVGFHPQYLFSGEAADDVSHFTNRAPYPILQVLRAASVEKAVEGGDTLSIPEKNIATLRALSREQLRALFPWADP